MDETKTTEEVWNKIKKYLTPANGVKALVGVGVGVGILYGIDKVFGMSEKYKDIIEKINAKISSNDTFETVDSFGDYLEFISDLTKSFGMKLDEGQVNKIGNFLQRIGTGGKILVKIIDKVKELSK